MIEVEVGVVQFDEEVLYVLGVVLVVVYCGVVGDGVVVLVEDYLLFFCVCWSGQRNDGLFMGCQDVGFLISWLQGGRLLYWFRVCLQVFFRLLVVRLQLISNCLSLVVFCGLLFCNCVLSLWVCVVMYWIVIIRVWGFRFMVYFQSLWVFFYWWWMVLCMKLFSWFMRIFWYIGLVGMMVQWVVCRCLLQLFCFILRFGGMLVLLGIMKLLLVWCSMLVWLNIEVLLVFGVQRLLWLVMMFGVWVGMLGVLGLLKVGCSSGVIFVVLVSFLLGCRQ